METIFGGKQSESSKKLYFHNLTKLNGKEPTNLNFLKKTTEIMEKINALKSRNTARSYIIAVVSAVKEDPKLYKIYYPELEKINKELKENVGKSEKQEENWITQESISTIQKEMMTNLPKKSKKTLTKDEYEKLLNLVVLSLYTLQSPRRLLDYQLMKVEDGEDKDFNYYNKGVFVFNNFKTKGKYMTQIQSVPKELNDLIKVYLKYKPKENNFLLNHYDGTEFKYANEITRILNKIFDKKISCSMLRNIYLTDKFSPLIKEMKETAQTMGTSVNMIETQYAKQD